MRSSVAAKRDEEGPDGGKTGALAALAKAARRVEQVAGAGSANMLAGALLRLTQATQAVEELAARDLDAGRLAETAYAAGYADGEASRHLRPVR